MSAGRPSDVLARAERYLGRHGVDAPRTTAEVLLASTLGTDRAGLYVRSEPLSYVEARSFGRALCQRGKGTPLQHITGEQGFRRLRLEVRPGVFVPRPETEVLVEVALAELAGIDGPLIVDVGTGTGAIALAIMDERPDARVVAIDRSHAAVELARSNAASLGIAIEVREGDLLGPVGELSGSVDLIASNPPYVRPEEVDALPADVMADPIEALVGGPDIIERLADAARSMLRPGGALVLEFGEAQGGEVLAILAERFANVRIETDLAGRDRVAVAS